MNCLVPCHTYWSLVRGLAQEVPEKYLIRFKEGQVTRHRIQLGHKTQDTGHRIQDTRNKTQDTGHRTQDTGHRTQGMVVPVATQQ